MEKENIVESNDNLDCSKLRINDCIVIKFTKISNIIHCNRNDNKFVEMDSIMDM